MSWQCSLETPRTPVVNAHFMFGTSTSDHVHLASSSEFAQEEPSPPHTPQASLTLPLFATPSQPAHDEPSPAHTPQASMTLPLFATPSQPAHDLPSPSHTPHASLSL